MSAQDGLDEAVRAWMLRPDDRNPIIWASFTATPEGLYIHYTAFIVPTPEMFAAKLALAETAKYPPT